MKYICLLFTLYSVMLLDIQLYAQQDSTIDDAGDIAFVAWSSSVQDGFAFVLLDDCPNATAIKFIDEEWTGSSFYTSNGEGENTWTNSTGSFVSKGTVIIIENADNNPTVNIGTISESDAGFDIAASSPDQIFAIIGSRSSPTFLSMIGHTTLPNNGTGSVQTLSGTGLTSGTNAIYLTSEAIYTGNTNCNSLTACNQMLNASSNWQTISGSVTFPSDVDSGFGGTALPVSLTTFDYSASGNSIYLRWSTAQELNNKGFNIQRKTQSESWETIGFVSGHGTTYNSTNYAFSDALLDLGLHYFYRLVQIDFDGAVAFSKILSTSIAQLHDLGVYWYKSPSGLHIVSSRYNIEDVYIVDCLGKLVTKKRCFGAEVSFTNQLIQKDILYAIVGLENTTVILNIVLTDDS
ncbi:MAG: hypothetical protein ACI8SE_000214 [Bacteroidia bacterium]|jgi:hypothetical protein